MRAIWMYPRRVTSEMSASGRISPIQISNHWLTVMSNGAAKSRSSAISRVRRAAFATASCFVGE